MKIKLPQISLVTGIMDLCTRMAAEYGHPDLPAMPHQLNAIVDAANIICAAFGEDNKPAVAGMGVSAWINSHDTGLSSVAMCRGITGITAPRMRVEDENAHPHDPSDFGRCHRFLEACPGTREQLGRMAGKSPTWAKLVEAWPELTALYLEELPTGSAQRLYAKMKELGC